ncbi:MAG: helix-turn-helix domain-containing protein [Bacteroidota bacterium]
MSDLRYTVIKNKEQYDTYCELVEELAFSGSAEEKEDEIDLLLLLIEDWDRKQYPLPELDPVQLVKSLMGDNELRQKDLVEITGVGKSTISEILNYKKRMSKDVIRQLSSHFKIQQEALNRSYRLEGEGVDREFESDFSEIRDVKTGNTVSYDEEVEGLTVERPRMRIISRAS